MVNEAINVSPTSHKLAETIYVDEFPIMFVHRYGLSVEVEQAILPDTTQPFPDTNIVSKQGRSIPWNDAAGKYVQRCCRTRVVFEQVHDGFNVPATSQRDLPSRIGCFHLEANATDGLNQISEFS